MRRAAVRRKLPAVAVVVAAALLLLAGCRSEDPAPPTPLPSTGASGLRIAIPAYVDPKDSAFWQSVVDATPEVGDVIVNPNNGPGAAASERHVQLINTLRDAGVRVLGYVMTGWGERDAAAVEQDMDRWKDWYGVDDIFLDEAASDAEGVDTYADYVSGIHESGGIAVLNPGIVPDRGYFEFADAIVTFEDPMDNYLSKEPPEWLGAEMRAEKWHIVSGAPQDRLGEVVDRAREQGAAKIFVTDDQEPNPYDSLPTYWSAKRDAVGE